MLVRRPMVAALVTVFALAACAGGQATSTPAPTAVPSPTTESTPTTAPTSAPTPTAETPTASPSPDAPPTVSPSPEASPTVEPSPSASPPAVGEGCRSPSITGLKNPPRLTLSTDIPAFPPWWGGDPTQPYPNKPEDAPEWELSDPYSMEGYESATAYAIADALGFAPDQVDWIPNAVFEQAFAPGEKPFDFHLAQISIRPRRAEAVDFSTPYFDANQSILALTPNEITSATAIEELKAFQLGAAANTTSFELIEDVVQPTQEPQVFNDNAAALQALRNEQIDGLVVDLQTALFMRDAQLEDFGTPDPEGTIVGQFDVSAQVDQMGLVLEKDSPLTDCVSEALAVIEADGTLDAIYEEWISTGQEIPFFE